MAMKSPRLRRLTSLSSTNGVSSEEVLNGKRDSIAATEWQQQSKDRDTFLSTKKPGDLGRIVSQEVKESEQKPRRKPLPKQVSVKPFIKPNKTNKKTDNTNDGKKLVKSKVKFRINTAQKSEQMLYKDDTMNANRFVRQRNPNWKQASNFVKNYGFRPAVNAQRPTTKYLEMLKISPQGVFDIENMKSKSSSRWVEKLVKQIRNSASLSEENILESLELIQGPKLNLSSLSCDKEQTQTDVINLPQIVINDCSVSLIENETIEPRKILRRSKDYGSVSCLLFALECDEKMRNFPKFNLLEIAECLTANIDIEQVEFIQRRCKRWEIVVRGDEIKEQLLNNGLVVRGRWYAFIEDPFFMEYYTKDIACAIQSGNHFEIWQRPRASSLVEG